MNIRLGLCSAYSFLYGVHRPGELVDRAASFGVSVVSVCDLNNLYGVHTFIEAAKERGVRPVIGAALTVPPSGKVYCFVENRAGFGRLCEILTLRNKNKENFNPLPLLAENAGGLALASADNDVLAYLAGKTGQIYGAVTPFSPGAVGPSRRLGIPLCFLDDSLFLDSGDYAVHRVLRAIGLLKTIGNLGPGDCPEEQGLAGQDRIMRSSKDLHRFLASWPEAVKGTQKIAELCRFNELFDGWVFPGYEAGGLTAGEELRRRVSGGGPVEGMCVWGAE